MNIDERLERISQDVQFLLTVQRAHNDQIAKLVEEGARNQERMKELDAKIGRLTDGIAVLNERTIQAMDAIGRLANIAGAHQDRLDDPEPLD
jgi:chromosome segregation ATPase